jgi:putative ABC transport system ATP-binding protein
LAALDKNYQGEIKYNGTELNKINKNKYRALHIGVVFQSYHLLFHASAIDNVKMGLYLAGKRVQLKPSAKELLLKVGISEDKHPRNCLRLSGGEQQRVAIARALAGDPDIIIADEPTGNLDEANQELIMDIFTKVAHEDGKCVIIATHSKYVMQRADQMISLE